ncbi:LCP family protein [Candidatus Saccharibacteria bacterium]|nr:LCP family protein [Candidatus Saccharibacteria bacterium]
MSYRPAGAGSSAATLEGVNLAKTVQKKKESSWLSWKKAILILFIIIITPLLFIGIWDLRNFSSASQKLFGSSNMFSLLATSQLKSTNEGRTNILIIGYSADDPGHGGAKLTDSIMVLSLDKSDKSGYMLSVPRDLYVSIPDYGKAKINEAYQAGERKTGSTEGGVNLLKDVITENFAIDIHYYVIVDYGATKNIVDALGGVNMNIESPDPRGIYDPNFKPEEGGPLKLANGAQEIDGQTALRLTRARGSTYGSYGFPQSDFNRTQNQQKVLSAIKSELNWTLVLDPRTNSKIFAAVADNVITNLEISEVIPIYRLFTSVPNDQLKTITLNNVNNVNLLTGHRTPNGQSALVPAAGISDFSDIQRALKQLGF